MELQPVVKLGLILLPNPESADVGAGGESSVSLQFPCPSRLHRAEGVLTVRGWSGTVSSDHDASYSELFRRSVWLLSVPNWTLVKVNFSAPARVVQLSPDRPLLTV